LAFQQVGGGDEPPPVHPIATAGVVVAAEDPVVQKGYGGVKLKTYDGTTCLGTFLAAVGNFSTYYKWNENDELFHLKARLRGPASQVLWDLGTEVKLQDLMRLLRKRFGTSDLVERFRTELRTRRKKPGKDLQSLYNDICRLMSLAYPGPTTDLVNVFGCDTF